MTWSGILASRIVGHLRLGCHHVLSGVGPNDGRERLGQVEGDAARPGPLWVTRLRYESKRYAT